MIPFPNDAVTKAPPTRIRLAILAALLLLATGARAGDAAYTNLLVRGETAVKKGDVPEALKCYAQAERLAGTNCADLCGVARYYCESMRDIPDYEVRKKLVALARDCSAKASTADPQNPLGHLSLAITYGRSLDYGDNETKVRWSKAIKMEAEKTIALDPNQDIAYYLLGRWNLAVANMNFLIRGWVNLIYGGLPKASYQEAARDFKKAIEIAPNRIIHHAGLALAYEALGDTKLELVELRKCQTLNPVDQTDAEQKSDAARKLAELER